MTTVKKLKEQEAQAEEQLKQMLGETGANDEATEKPADESVIPASEEVDLVEENRKLSEALKALRGKYNAEVPRLTQQLRDAQKQLEEAKVAQKKAESDAVKANDELSAKLESLRADYGDDIVEVMQSIAEKTQDTKQPIEAGEDAVDRFWRNLRRRVPDFDEVNTNSEFLTWLQGASSSGLTYQQVLNEAGNDLDYEVCADIFAQFKAEKAKNKAPTAQDFAAPPRGQQSREHSQKKQYTPQDWITLQDDIRKGKYRGREAEAAALEKEIHAAIHGY